MLKTSISSIAVAAFFAAVPALAADLDKGDPTSANYEAPISFTGFYLGALGGYQFSNSELSAEDVYTDKNGVTVYSTEATIDGLGAEGLFGEVQIGFDKQIGTRLIVGAVAGLNLSNGEFEIDASTFNANATPQNVGYSLLSFEQEWGGILGARVGYLTTQSTMFYVGGGWAFGEIGNVQSDFGGPNGTGGNVFTAQETDLSGWYAELGLETRVHDNVYLTVAGRYTDYSAITLDRNEYADGHDAIELDHDLLTVMAGLKIKLNGGLGF